jgi:Ca-activated chloride channel family protein
MEFLWPRSLYLLGLFPLIIVAYFWILRRRRKYAVRYSSLALVREAIPRSSRLRRHLPFGLFMLGLTGLVLALSRPTTTVTVPYGNVSVILAVDVSRSMCSTDIPPNRLKAAQAAMLSFIERQDPNTLIGIVAFAGFSEIIQPPTGDQEALRQAVNNLNPARRTAVGSGILKIGRAHV